MGREHRDIRLRGGELSPREAVQSFLDRIEAVDGDVNSYIAVRAEEALAEADALAAGAGVTDPASLNACPSSPATRWSVRCSA